MNYNYLALRAELFSGEEYNAAYFMQYSRLTYAKLNLQLINTSQYNHYNIIVNIIGVQRSLLRL